MEWSNDDVFEFLEHYQGEPVIWNAPHPNHKDRNFVFDAWKRIEQKLKNKYSLTELKKKKNSLMASFRSCYKKVKESMKSGAATQDVYKPTWFAYEKMFSFLKDKDEARPTINSEDLLSLTGSINENSDDSNSEIDSNIPMNHENTHRMNKESAIDQPQPSTSTATFKSPLPKKKKTTEINDLKKKMDEAYTLLQSSVHKPVKEKDFAEKYGEVVAARLRELNERNRDVAINRIDNLLFEIKMNQMSSADHPVLADQNLVVYANCPQSSPSDTAQSSSSTLISQAGSHLCQTYTTMQADEADESNNNLRMFYSKFQ